MKTHVRLGETIYISDLHNCPQEGVSVVATGDRIHQPLPAGLEQLRKLSHLLPHEQEI